MKKLIFIIPALLIFILLGILFFPRSIENAVVLKTDYGSTTMYVGSNIKKFSTPNLSYPKYTVISFKYNLFKTFNFKVSVPITERVMIKSDKSYDLEKSGSIPLTSKRFYYTIDKNDNISLSSSQSLIIGKYNLKSYKSKNGKLKTFLIYPLDYSTMRVGISTNNFDSVYHNKSDIKCNSPAVLYSVRDGFSMNVPKDTLITIQPDKKSLKVSTGSFSKVFKNRVYLKGASMTMKDISRGYPAFNPDYSGILEFNLSGNQFSVINEVNLEDYLTKVVPSEMPLSGGIEALKCQAVAARTYAISDMLASRFASLGFYVDDSTQSQVYNNVPAQKLSTAAVMSTIGLIMSYNNMPIDAKYYSTSSGTGAAYSDIWFKGDGTSEYKPYLTNNNYTTPPVALPSSEEGWLSFYKNINIKAIDSVSPYFRWNVELPLDALNKSVNKALKLIFNNRKEFITVKKGKKVLKTLPKLGQLKDIKTIKRGKSGNIMELALIFNNAEVDVKGDLNIRSVLRCSTEFTGVPIAINRNNASSLNNTTFLPSSFFSIEKQGNSLVLYGGGYGHGVGMSQYGAMQLSKGGMPYKDILNIFYKNIKLNAIY